MIKTSAPPPASAASQLVTPSTILLCHNYYQQPGGEDRVFEDEAQLLASRGHHVVRYTLHNDAIHAMGKFEISRRTFWNNRVYHDLRALIRRTRPAIMHCTNTFPLISPAAYYAARNEGVKVVQTLQNFRLLCPGGYFMREGRVCEQCLNKLIPWPAVQHGCYRDSRLASGVLSSMLALHRAMRTWRKAVSLYVVASEFTRQKFLQAGFPADRLVVKPNFVHPRPEPGCGGGGYALFVGRLSPEKGIDTLLAAWPKLAAEIPLKILGDGPLAEKVAKFADAHSHVQWLGAQPPAEVQRIMSDAALLVFPSVWYEGMPKTIIESFAVGTPIVASKIGAMQAMVEDGITGLHFEPGNSADLAAKVHRLWSDPSRRLSMRLEARRQYECEYTSEKNYDALLAMYRQALAGAQVVTGKRI